MDRGQKVSGSDVFLGTRWEKSEGEWWSVMVEVLNAPVSICWG
jgi:hypothetical protein